MLKLLGFALPGELHDSVREPDMIWCQVAMRYFLNRIHSLIGCVSLISNRWIIVATSIIASLELTPEIMLVLQISSSSYFVITEAIIYTTWKPGKACYNVDKP